MKHNEAQNHEKIQIIYGQLKPNQTDDNVTH
jgi:hypothetical protein